MNQRPRKARQHVHPIKVIVRTEGIAGTMDLHALETLVASYALPSGPAWYAVEASV